MGVKAALPRYTVVELPPAKRQQINPIPDILARIMLRHFEQFNPLRYFQVRNILGFRCYMFKGTHGLPRDLAIVYDQNNIRTGEVLALVQRMQRMADNQHISNFFAGAAFDLACACKLVEELPLQDITYVFNYGECLQLVAAGGVTRSTADLMRLVRHATSVEQALQMIRLANQAHTGLVLELFQT